MVASAVTYFETLLGSSVISARSRSYVGGYGPLEPGPIGPGLGGFPGITLLGSSVNRGGT